MYIIVLKPWIAGRISKSIRFRFILIQLVPPDPWLRSLTTEQDEQDEQEGTGSDRISICAR